MEAASCCFCYYQTGFIRFTVSGHYHSCGGCEEKLWPQLSPHLRRRIQNQANLLHQRFVLIMSLMLLILLLKHTSKENSPVTSVYISPIKFKDSILNKEQLKRSYQASDFLPETEISPSRSEMNKTQDQKSI